MPLDPVDQLIALASAGGALVLAGVLGALPGDRRRARLAAAVGPAGLALAATAVASPAALPLTASVLAAVLLVAGALGSRRLAAARARAGRVVAAPGTAAVAGLVVVVATAAAMEREWEAQTLSDTEATELAGEGPPPRRPDRVAAVTDRGRRIELTTPAEPRDPAEVRARGAELLPRMSTPGTLIRRGPADERTNCFGWVFARGRSWLPDSGIDPILSDHGYRPVTDPRPGDVVVYRNTTTGVPLHAAVVRYVTGGQPVLVEGKWGWMGVFVHEADGSPYGSAYTYYRTARPTHHLALIEPGSGPDGPLLGAE